MFGYINMDGEYVIEPQFKVAKSFSGNLAAAIQGKKWGFINMQGEVLRGKWYQNAELFVNTKR
jgi:hypothetical protein